MTGEDTNGPRRLAEQGPREESGVASSAFEPLVIAGPTSGLGWVALVVVGFVALLLAALLLGYLRSSEVGGVLALCVLCLLALTIVARYNSRNWFELDSTELRHYRAGRFCRRFLLADLRDAKSKWHGIRLVFERGSLRLNPSWQNASSALAELQSRLDSTRWVEAATWSSEHARVPLRYLTFPEGCIGCRGAGGQIRRLLCGWCIHLGHAPLDHSVEIEVEVCEPCRRRRRRVTALGWLGLGAAIIAYGLVIVELSTPTTPWKAVVLVAGLLLVGVVLPNWLANGFRKTWDLRILGVTGRRYFRRVGDVELECRDSNLAYEICWLSDSDRQRRLERHSQRGS